MEASKTVSELHHEKLGKVSNNLARLTQPLRELLSKKGLKYSTIALTHLSCNEKTNSDHRYYLKAICTAFSQAQLYF